MPTDEQASAEEIRALPGYESARRDLEWLAGGLHADARLQLAVVLSEDANLGHVEPIGAARKALEDAAHECERHVREAAAYVEAKKLLAYRALWAGRADWLRARAAKMYPNDHETKETD